MGRRPGGPRALGGAENHLGAARARGSVSPARARRAPRRAPAALPAGARYDFHSHTFLTDGSAAATDMWRQAEVLGHRALAVTDHLMMEDPAPLLERLRQERVPFEGCRMAALIGVEISMLPPARIADAARAARRAGAEVIVVHGETTAEPVYPGTNRAAIVSGEVDVLAHPGLLSLRDAELAKAHGVALEISPRRGHSLSNGRVAAQALRAGASLVVDSDAHAPDQLVPFETARRIAEGAGVPPGALARVLSDGPREIVRRCRGRSS